eukprot:6728644-Prymnesium_polylepis.1
MSSIVGDLPKPRQADPTHPGLRHVTSILVPSRDVRRAVSQHTLRVSVRDCRVQTHPVLVTRVGSLRE